MINTDNLGQNIPLAFDALGDISSFQVETGTVLDLQLDLRNMNLVVTNAEFPQGWYLIGDNNDWSATDMSYPFVQDPNNKNIYSIHVDIEDGDFWFKIANKRNYYLDDFWSGSFLSAAINGESALSGSLVEGNVGAFCIPANYNATYLDITIDVENLTYTIETDGEAPQEDPNAMYDYVYIAGTADGWSGYGGKLASFKGENNYFGFFKETGEFKIQKNQGSWAENWGGSNETLVFDGANIPADGLVYVNANIGAMTYSVTYITSMGVVGDAYNPDWSTDAPLTYNEDNNTWEGVVTFNQTGEIKFRANGEWDVNFGGPLNDLVSGGSNINVEAGTYNIVLSLICPGEYTATITPVD